VPAEPWVAVDADEPEYTTSSSFPDTVRAEGVSYWEELIMAPRVPTALVLLLVAALTTATLATFRRFDSSMVNRIIYYSVVIGRRYIPAQSLTGGVCLRAEIKIGSTSFDDDFTSSIFVRLCS
jgi:hypothetical protein